MLPQDYAPAKFIKELSKLDSSKSMGEKFRDFLELAYCAYAKKTADTPERADELEARYMKVVGTYRNKDAVRKYPELLAMAVMGVQDGLDYLGDVSSQLEILDAKQGQFFTPMSVSLLMAQVTIGDLKPQIEERGYLSFGEMAAGAGCIILAAAQVFRQQGFNPNIHMMVHAADISNLAYQMCFLQLSMAGVAAYVERANSLSGEHFEGAWTLAAYIFREHHGHTHFDKPRESNAEDAVPAESTKPIPATPPALKQLSLF